MQSIQAFVFDVFGTVVDWRTGVANVADRFFSQKNIDFDPFQFADLWRGEYQPAMERIRSGNRGYVALDILHRENLDIVLAKTGLTAHFSEEEKTVFNTAWEKLPPWPDSVPGLEELKNKFIIAPCSNGSIALMTRLAKFGNLPWDCILGAEIARNYKPHRDVYIASASALRLNPEQVVMVAAHNDDLVAARKNGLKTAFIPRPREHGLKQESDLEPTDEWDFVIESIGQLATIR